MNYTLTEQLIRHEGLRLKPYRCPAGKLTIGIGRNLEDRGITEEEARYLLQNDINSVILALQKAIPEIFRNISYNRQSVLVNMGFNLGVQGLLGFKKMLAALANCNFELAAKEMLDSKWARQVGKRATELADMMIRG
ncbi:MAG: glycoside hydrolase family protein [Thiohalomonadaceae bacterium]